MGFKNGLHSLHQFKGMKRLGNVVGAEIVADAGVDILGVGSHNHHRDMPGA